MWLGHVSWAEGSPTPSLPGGTRGLCYRPDMTGVGMVGGLARVPSRHRPGLLDVTAALGVLCLDPGGKLRASADVSRVHRTWTIDDSWSCTDLCVNIEA